MAADEPAEVANKVLRRAQVAKMTRALENSLALASVKVKHGWENMSIDTLEPKIEMELKRKRPHDTFSDTSSSVSERFFSNGTFDSSPITAPMFSDEATGGSGSTNGFGRRARYQQQARRPVSSTHARTKVRTSTTNATSWKSTYKLPESSPVYHARHARFTTSHVPHLSFVSEVTTVPDDPASPSHSEDDDEDLPVPSFHVGNHHIRSSPPPPAPRTPRTPSPDIARSARMNRNKAFNPSRGQAGEEGADLLMFLAASPSPANPGAKTRVFPPTTPPAKQTPLPSSMMSTPGGGQSAFTGFGAQTPGMMFNFADYVNVTPSPGQAAWMRTPGPTRTPIAAREARRRLNFEGLHPPTGDSPEIGSHTRSGNGKAHGLGMELGGELVSSQ
ncbi:hypothetical protein K402DRAFT_411635 [Aulographum hederae CBS 113979]|uniref:Uncharacterized protein n=1 Tax=Aulographum hederae CBS 113979 TaxID=1176131 RepID=A0A6G1H5H1_9PEZI|nr:hypothetical protein K402DRAFT_411635 [Aulographum hederae CBS 113979]